MYLQALAARLCLPLLNIKSGSVCSVWLTSHSANGTVRVRVCVRHEMRHFMAGAASQLLDRGKHSALSISARVAYPWIISVLPRRVGCLSSSAICLSAQVFLKIHCLRWDITGRVYWMNSQRTRVGMIEYEFQFGLGYLYAQRYVTTVPTFSTVSRRTKQTKVISHKMSWFKVHF